VKSEDVGGGPQAANVAELLRGRVAGLDIRQGPDGGYMYRIRGLSQESPEPLFVIDGIQVMAKDVPSALSGLTRNDIRQVDVLKDLASTSIYGQRGVGGVILITTRR
jgi:TonB-dependent SusC/RagA subfamily outer membrane receptor